MKELEAASHPKDFAESLGGGLQNVLKAHATEEKIYLLEKQIAVVMRCIEQSQSLEQKECYSASLCKLESELDDLVLI